MLKKWSLLLCPVKACQSLWKLCWKNNCLVFSSLIHQFQSLLPSCLNLRLSNFSEAFSSCTMHISMEIHAQLCFNITSQIHRFLFPFCHLNLPLICIFIFQCKVCALKSENAKLQWSEDTISQITLRATALDAVCLCVKWRSSWLVSF